MLKIYSVSGLVKIDDKKVSIENESRVKHTNQLRL
jgi:hypothetical protein